MKSFIGPSPVDDLKTALGQFILYHDILAEQQPDRELYLAVRVRTFESLFEEPIGKILLANHRVRLVIFDPDREEIKQWTT